MSTCLTIQYDSQIVTCETAKTSTDPMLKGTGNLASGMTDIVAKKNQMCAIQANLGTSRNVLYCSNAPWISPYAGGNISSKLLQSQIQQDAICNAKQNLAVALLRQVPVCTPVTDTRFHKYIRRGPPVPCTPPPPDVVIPFNPAVPKPVDGPCVIVPGYVYNRIN